MKLRANEVIIEQRKKRDIEEKSSEEKTITNKLVQLHLHKNWMMRQTWSQHTSGLPTFDGLNERANANLQIQIFPMHSVFYLYILFRCISMHLYCYAREWNVFNNVFSLKQMIRSKSVLLCKSTSVSIIHILTVHQQVHEHWVAYICVYSKK